MLSDLGAALDRKGEGDAVQVDDGLGLVANRVFGLAEILPHGDHHEGQHHGIEHADHRELEPGDLVVEA